MNDRLPQVSVLMCVYNTEAYLAEAVESILNQKFRDFEFIIVDDGSTDGSLDLLNRYAAQDGRIRVCAGPHAGISRARNTTLKEARGEYCAIMDSDDIAVPERIEMQVNFLKANPQYAAVGCSFLLVDPDGLPLRELIPAPDHENIWKRLLVSKQGAGGGATFRRDAMLAVGGFREHLIIAEDLDILLRLGEKYKLANLPDILLKHRLHPESTCHSTDWNAAMNCVRGILADAYARMELGAPPEPEYKQLTPQQRYRLWSWWASNNGFTQSARKYAVKSLRTAPLSVKSWYMLFKSYWPRNAY